jgi:GNAT superfamily N-acetyltransferase
VGVVFSPPETLTSQHRLDDFESGEASLDNWLKRRALPNQANGASRTFVVPADDQVIAYYALAAASVELSKAPGRFRRNMPDPIPVALLGRLAVDRRYQGHGLGRALVGDCAARVSRAAEALGIRGIMVHAISQEAKRFYLATGFDPFPLEPMTLVVSLEDIRALLHAPH